MTDTRTPTSRPHLPCPECGVEVYADGGTYGEHHAVFADAPCTMSNRPVLAPCGGPGCQVREEGTLIVHHNCCPELDTRGSVSPPCGVADCTFLHEPANPPRGTLCPRVTQAAITIHQEVWNEPYSVGSGPMHHAGGGYHRRELLRKADRWERLAAAARVCAEVLPHG